MWLRRRDGYDHSENRVENDKQCLESATTYVSASGAKRHRSRRSRYLPGVRSTCAVTCKFIWEYRQAHPLCAGGRKRRKRSPRKRRFVFARKVDPPSDRRKVAIRGDEPHCGPKKSLTIDLSLSKKNFEGCANQPKTSRMHQWENLKMVTCSCYINLMPNYWLLGYRKNIINDGYKRFCYIFLL